jgi:carboxy-cis,cis-muconate cyclase
MKGLIALSWITIPIVALIPLVTGTKHNMFVSSFRTRHLFALSYDNETGTLDNERTMMGSSGHTWMTFNADKTILFASQRDGWTSYKVLSPTSLAQTASVTLMGTCKGQRIRHGQTVLYASKAPPYAVYGAGRSPCGIVMNLGPDGSLGGITQNLAYEPPLTSSSANSSRVEGFAMSSDGRWLFSADSRGEGIWIHAVDAKGALSTVRFVPIRVEDVRPRRLVMHPSGQFLYVLNRRPSELFTFQVIPGSSPDRPPDLRMLDVTISLVPTGKSRIDSQDNSNEKQVCSQTDTEERKFRSVTMAVSSSPVYDTERRELMMTTTKKLLVITERIMERLIVS